MSHQRNRCGFRRRAITPTASPTAKNNTEIITMSIDITPDHTDATNTTTAPTNTASSAPATAPRPGAWPPPGSEVARVAVGMRDLVFAIEPVAGRLRVKMYLQRTDETGAQRSFYMLQLREPEVPLLVEAMRGALEKLAEAEARQAAPAPRTAGQARRNAHPGEVEGYAPGVPRGRVAP
jgi:hypothetical protein